ncbi:MAG TPA: UDP-N-acetylmuramate dehydrogenase [Candidatus Gallacutalibacter stercoravium]|nr:UDP-N-acetylmuramate dehydrogenase [Candidatus Gallacutalibacter stercoravium]
MNRYDELIQTAGRYGCQVYENEPMSKRTTFRIGGPADVLIEAHTQKAAAGLIALCRERELPLFFLGNGSDLLVPDEGLRGVVLHLTGEFRQISQLEDGRILCGAGATLARLCKFAQQNVLTGLEFAWGIPGSAGGAAYMNAGAYGGEMKDVLAACRHITRSGQTGRLEGDALQMGYRRSAYTENGHLITALEISLQKGDAGSIAARMEELMERREQKQPLEYPSAGSVFKRPAGHFAGGLIEQCGLKGTRVGGAVVSPKHAGFIVNDGGATSNDVRQLIELIQQTVLRETGVQLECEIKILSPKG